MIPEKRWYPGEVDAPAGDLATHRPARFHNHERLLRTLEERNIDGVVAYLRPNVLYLGGYAPRSSVSIHETNGYAAVVVSRHAPDHPVLVCAEFDLDYVLEVGTWIDDVRAFATLLLPFDVPISPESFDRFVPEAVRATTWGARARENYLPSLVDGVRSAFADLGLVGGRVGFDDLRFAGIFSSEVETVDAYGTFKHVREVKTAEEVVLLRRAAALNQKAIEDTVAAWQPGATWEDLTKHYHRVASDLGGYIHDPGAFVVANPQGAEAAFYMMGRREDYVLEPGMSMMFDCHGTIDHYCWDGGKTWVVGDERQGLAKRIEDACVTTMTEMEAAMVPGTHLSELQQVGRDVFRRHGVPGTEDILLFFHGIGLEHIDLEITSPAGRLDWKLEEGMVLSTHLVYPGDDRTRYYIEDNVVVEADGGASIYAWTFDSL